MKQIVGSKKLATGYIWMQNARVIIISWLSTAQLWITQSNASSNLYGDGI